MKAFKFTGEIMANCYICSLQKLIVSIINVYEVKKVAVTILSRINWRLCN